MIEYLLTAVIIAQLVFLYFYDRANRKERADLTLQLMSRSLTEYAEAKEVLEDEPEKNRVTSKPPVEYQELEDIDYEQLVGAGGF